MPQPTTVKGQRKTKHFQPIHYASKTMTEAQAHYTTTEKELLAVVYAFEKFRPYLVLSKSIVYTDHSALKYLLAKQDAKPRFSGVVCSGQEALRHSKACHIGPIGGTLRANYTLKRSSIQVSIGPRSTRMPTTLSPDVTFVNVKAKFCNVMRCLKTLSKFAKSLTCGALILWGRSRLQEETNISSRPMITCQDMGYASTPHHDPELFANFSNLSLQICGPSVQS
ncbi:reverse transcriptase domain-containing protein [Tanacetum coccineum]